MSSLIRLQRDADTLQLDFMTMIHGMRTFEGIRSRAVQVDVGDGWSLCVASLKDLDHPPLPVKAALPDSKPAKRLPAKQRSLKQRKPRRKQVLDALKKESERALIEQIRHHLSLPVEKRMNFLRKRIGLTATCL